MIDPTISYKPGPLTNEAGIPYDYIVIIDAGSKGSRVFVYNWLNPEMALKNHVDLNESLTFKDFKLVKRIDVPDNHQLADSKADPDSDDELHLDDDDQKDSSNDSNNPKPPSSKLKIPAKLPHIKSKKKWKHKVKPGISTFNNSPQKIGKHHLKYLLATASRVVPKSQHYRTPIFLHSTAGMRLLTPLEQQKILNNICEYFQSQSDFFLPDCASHINVIEGDIEGIYGWLAINYLVGSFDNPMNHQHGKDHTTYGLLDMGGASTQVVFQPNLTEIAEHENNLYKINLFELPVLNKDEKGGGRLPYSSPNHITHSIYSDSFLGLGMSQAYNKYVGSLIENSSDSSSFFDNPPLTDPCKPKGFRTDATVNGVTKDFIGDSDFEKCLTSIFPVISQSSYGAASQASGNCKQYNDGDKVSSCLLNDLIPAFDFDINHFYGVSGYWYAISNLMTYNEPVKLASRSDGDGKKSKDADYDYKVIYDNTKNFCSKSYRELIELNQLNPEKFQLPLEDLTNLCFESSWILNFLHLGLGFPRFGIDDVDQAQKDKFKSLQIVDKVNGAEFSWTLGRAILYSNDEYIQAFNNYTKEQGISTLKDEHTVDRAGFTFSVAPNAYHYGSEQSGIASRPRYTPIDPETKYHYYDYETDDVTYGELKWYIEPHRWYGIVIFGLLLSFILWLMLGKQGRLKLNSWGKDIVNKLTEWISRRRSSNRYVKINDLEASGLRQEDLELSDLEGEQRDSVNEDQNTERHNDPNELEQKEGHDSHHQNLSN